MSHTLGLYSVLVLILLWNGTYLCSVFEQSEVEKKWIYYFNSDIQILTGYKHQMSIVAFAQTPTIE